MARPSLELPASRASHGVLIGIVLAVMGTGFALAMPIAMRTWTEAAQRTEAVERVNAADSRGDEFSDLFAAPEPVLVPPIGPQKREPDRPQEDHRPTSVAARENTPEQPLVASDPEDPPGPPPSGDNPERDEPRDEDRPIEPDPQEGKREEEEEETESPPDPYDDDDSQDRSDSGRATGRDEEEEPRDEPEPEKDDDKDTSHSGDEESGGGSKGHPQGTKH